MRILLAYSGDHRTTTAIAWLREQHHADVVTATIDLGPGRELEATRDRALAAGAVRAHVIDARDQFARDFILPALKADAVADARFAMAVSLSRPLIARKLIDLAEIERADAVAHGAVGRNGSPAPLHRLLQSLKPALCVIAVPSSRHDRSADAEVRMAPLFPEENVEANLWGRTVRLSRLLPDATDATVVAGEYPASTVASPSASSPGGHPGRDHVLTRNPADCPDEPAEVEVAFDQGVPVAVNGVRMPLLELIASLSTIAGAHGVGRAVADGRLSEAPAAVVLQAAHERLQARAIPADLQAFARAVSLKYVDLVRDGLWFSALREALDGFVDRVQERVTGGVRLTLFKGNVVKH